MKRSTPLSALKAAAVSVAGIVSIAGASIASAHPATYAQMPQYSYPSTSYYHTVPVSAPVAQPVVSQRYPGPTYQPAAMPQTTTTYIVPAPNYYASQPRPQPQAQPQVTQYPRGYTTYDDGTALILGAMVLGAGLMYWITEND